VDAELKQYLIEMEERLTSSLNAYGNEVSSLKGYVNERCEQVETKLLTEFHKGASPAEVRSRTISAALRAIDLESAANADLAKKLEGRHPQ
jgi:hypothetical protein